MNKKIRKSNRALSVKLVFGSILLIMLILLSACSKPNQTNEYRLSISFIGSGKVVSDTGFECSADCQESIEAGKEIVLTARAIGQSGFKGWAGDCPAATISSKCRLTMDSDKAVSLKFVEEKVINIPDANLAKRLRQILKLAANEDITTSNILGLTVLIYNGIKLPDSERISNLEGLQYAVNLTRLELQYNKITNIEALKTLTKLKKLALNHNHISNFSSIKDLIYLKELFISGNPISDFSPIKALTQLEMLNLYQTKISDISFLANFTNLEILYLHDNEITDITALKPLKNLKRLALSDNKISDIKALVENTGLSGANDTIYIEKNCLDINAGEDKANVQKLLDRGIKLSYKPQKTSGCS